MSPDTTSRYPEGLNTHAAIAEIEPTEWDTLAGDNPFVGHAFLHALEATGCASPKTGWQPLHLTERGKSGLRAAMPLYLKSHSFGEFVFDWAWANAFEQHGIRYYPKLVSAVPFSPVTGTRLLGQTGATDALAEAVVELAEARELSSIHCLFPTAAEARALAKKGWLLRTDCHFHWHNRGYRDFDDFLDTFSSAKRKKVRRERRRVTEAGVEFQTLHGQDLDDALLDEVYRCYCLTYFERGRPPYLNREFFATIARELGPQLVIFLACREKRVIGAAICLKDKNTLYGRHWGADTDVHSLHFETCYYQGIDYCIREGLQHFDPGAQGQHKISRGFEPTTTYSAHWVTHPGFRDAIADYLSRERLLIADYHEEVNAHLPFKK